MSENDSAALISINVPTFEKLLKGNPQFNTYEREVRWAKRSNKDGESKNEQLLDIPAYRFSEKALKDLFKIFQDAGSAMGDRHVMGQVQAHLNALQSPDTYKCKTLQSGVTAIKTLIQTNADAVGKLARGWLFHKNDLLNLLQPVLATSAGYSPPGKESPPYVFLRCVYSERDSQGGHSFTWHRSKCVGKSATEMLHNEGLFLETEALIKEYDKREEQFFEWREMLGEQFIGKGTFHAQGEDRWSRRKVEMKGLHKLVVDDKCKGLELRASNRIFGEAPAEVMQEEGDASDQFTQIPITPFIWCFSLEEYTAGWVYMECMTPYEYKPELRAKLILPPEHEDIVDALTSDMDILQEDIVVGKTGGTAIMCQGKAGTGKTLLAEIYSEVIKRPLYRVHSGQLGTTADEVEAELKKALDNATRWRAAMLIDEADVFVAERGDDLEKNAVISVFLRVMEYYPGLLFLTTNRIDSIDEAILSRCIAHIKFDLPTEAQRVKLWKTLGEVYEFPLTKVKGMPEKLAAQFEKASGRDIKGLIKLTSKYARRREVKIDMALCIKMAAFKGL